MFVKRAHGDDLSQERHRCYRASKNHKRKRVRSLVVGVKRTRTESPACQTDPSARRPNPSARRPNPSARRPNPSARHTDPSRVRPLRGRARPPPQLKSVRRADESVCRNANKNRSFLSRTHSSASNSQPNITKPCSRQPSTNCQSHRGPRFAHGLEDAVCALGTVAARSRTYSKMFGFPRARRSFGLARHGF